jgi:hypothetical protein
MLKNDLDYGNVGLNMFLVKDFDPTWAISFFIALEHCPEHLYDENPCMHLVHIPFS